MSGKMTRPGGETSEDPTRTFGGPANANRTQQDDAQAMARDVKPTATNTSAAKPATGQNPRLPADQDYGGDGVPMRGTYANPSSSPLLGKP